MLIQFYKKFNAIIIVGNKKRKEEDENLATKKNEDWWRLEKFQIGRRKFS